MNAQFKVCIIFRTVVTFPFRGQYRTEGEKRELTRFYVAAYAQLNFQHSIDWNGKKYVCHQMRKFLLIKPQMQRREHGTLAVTCVEIRLVV